MRICRTRSIGASVGLRTDGWETKWVDWQLPFGVLGRPTTALLQNQRLMPRYMLSIQLWCLQRELWIMPWAPAGWYIPHLPRYSSDHLWGANDLASLISLPGKEIRTILAPCESHLSEMKVRLLLTNVYAKRTIPRYITSHPRSSSPASAAGLKSEPASAEEARGACALGCICQAIRWQDFKNSVREFCDKFHPHPLNNCAPHPF